MADADQTDTAPAASAPAKSTTAATVVAAPVAAVAAPERETDLRVTIDEFCQRKSLHPQSSVEMTTAFYREEKRAGVIKDSIENFEARLTAFANRPA